MIQDGLGHSGIPHETEIYVFLQKINAMVSIIWQQCPAHRGWSTRSFYYTRPL